MDHTSRGSYASQTAEPTTTSNRSIATLEPGNTVSVNATHRTVLRRPSSDVPVVAGSLRPRASKAASKEQVPNVPILIDDDFSIIGNWYLADSTNTQALDPRAEVYRLWSLALWEMAKSDETLFGCVAMLTLHKKRSIASRFDKVSYLDHKQRVYQSLCQTVASSGGNVTGVTALAMALLAFAEVREGNFEDAQRHINAVAIMDCVCQLDETQWRLVVWNDLRYALKTARLPTLRYYLPMSLTNALANIDGAVLAEARRLALGNWKHLKKYSSLDEGVWFQLLVSLHTISILVNSRTSVIQHAHLATAYEAEYQAHTIAANLAMQVEPKASDAFETLLIIACQLHILATTSNFAPSTVECRVTLLDRARSALVKLDISYNLDQTRMHDATLLWALSTFATHSMDGGFKDCQLFIQILAAIVDVKRVASKCAFQRILRAWPWTDTWHTIKVPALWAEILVVRGHRWRRIATDGLPGKCAKGKAGTFYAGILLFYES